MGYKINEEDFKRLAGRMTNTELAHEFGVDKRTITRWRSKTGIRGLNPGDPNATGKPLATDKVRQIQLMAEDEVPIAQIVATLGCGIRTVKRYAPGYRGVSWEENGQKSRALWNARRYAAKRKLGYDLSDL